MLRLLAPYLRSPAKRCGRGRSRARCIAPPGPRDGEVLARGRRGCGGAAGEREPVGGARRRSARRRPSSKVSVGTPVLSVRFIGSRGGDRRVALVERDLKAAVPHRDARSRRRPTRPVRRAGHAQARGGVMALIPLPPEAYRDLVRRALAEDVGAGDATSAATVPAGAARARRDRRQVAARRRGPGRRGRGVPPGGRRRGLRGPLGRWRRTCEAGDTVAIVTGDARALLDGRADRPQLPAAPLRHRDADVAASSTPRRDASPSSTRGRPRPTLARPREVRGALRRRHQPSPAVSMTAS